MAHSLPTLSPKKYSNLLMVNRASEAALELKLNKIRRDHARFKQDLRIKETQIWNELFESNRSLKKSLVTSAGVERDLLQRENLKMLSPPGDRRRGLGVMDRPDILIERNKEFIAFKAQMSSQLYRTKVTATATTRQLTLADRYRREINHFKNQQSFRRLIQLYTKEERSTPVGGWLRIRDLTE